MRIVPKRDLFSLCQPDDLRLLGFFVYQCFFKRKGYLIPKLEYVIVTKRKSELSNGFNNRINLFFFLRNWIPGIGKDLITANFDQKSSANAATASNKPESNPFTHLTDVFNVFTECGSLTSSEVYALFLFLRKSPDFENSSLHQQCNDFYATKTNKAHDSQGQTASEIEDNRSTFDKSFNIKN